MIATNAKLTLPEFWALPPAETNFELVQGAAVSKMAAKKFHAAVQKIVLRLLDDWNQGHALPEWSVTLQRQGEDWVPCPDVTYIAYARLPEDWSDTACPLPPDLAVEIISPGQTFGELAQKAEDYLIAGVYRVWVVDTPAKSLTVFYPDRPAHTYIGDQLLQDVHLPGLAFTPQQVFQRGRIG
ncbi:Uma2 family endonuclease [Candidatus Cyanaurora vandensis]|uniref:Uma2 family endonuclease n=1 Tax=Candidatus Cyanaurora vandensis TaxID=2714958 RepID=UPI002580AFBB|nr:Uma2 family endonuclease [Candidatus Cyanaurora vandensis]